MEPDEDSGNSLGLKIMFVLLFIILIGEIMYFFVLPIKKPFIPITPIIPTFAPLTPTPPPIQITKKPSPISVTPFISKTTYLTPVWEYQGKIVELNLTTITPVSGSKIEFSFKIEIDDGGTKKPHIFFFDKNELDNMKITNQLGKNIPYKNLKVGQTIKMIRMDDLQTKIFKGFNIAVID